MSKDKPTPGNVLKSYHQVVKEIKLASIGFSEGKLSAAEFDSFMKRTIEGFSLNPDGIEIVTHMLLQDAESQHAISNRHLTLALSLGAAVTGFEDKVKTHLFAKKGIMTPVIQGETHKYELIEEEPEIIIDEKSLPEIYKKMIYVPNVESIKKFVKLEACITGVRVQKRFSIKKSVIKKEVQNAAHA